MASLLVITGPPGAGKSTVAASVAAAHARSVLVEGDRFFHFLAQGAIEPWLPESHAQNNVVTEAAAAATGRFATDYETVYDGIVGPWFLPTFASATGLVAFDYVIILPPVEVCIARVRDRTGHGFTDEGATRKMHADFATSTIDSRHVVTEESLDAAETVRAVLTGRAVGRLRYAAGP